jgi:hypothetical protein
LSNGLHKVLAAHTKGNCLRHACRQRAAWRKSEQKYLANLGRVIDRQKGIFTKRERGIFQYSIESGYADVSSTYEESAMRSGKTEKLKLDFGDSFILDKYIRSLPFWDALSKVIPSDSDMKPTGELRTSVYSYYSRPMS